MATNCVVPSRVRNLNAKDEFVSFGEYMQTEDMPELVARGVLPFGFLQLGDRFKGCTEASHIQDVLFTEGFYARPDVYLDWDNEVVEGKEGFLAEWKVSYDRRRKAARERVKKRRQR